MDSHARGMHFHARGMDSHARGMDSHARGMDAHARGEKDKYGLGKGSLRDVLYTALSCIIILFLDPHHCQD